LYFPEFSENEDELVTDFSFIDYTDTLQAYMDAAVYSLEFTVEHNFRTRELSEDVEVPEELIDLYEEFKDEYSSPEADRLGRLISAADLSDIDAAFAIEDFPGRVFLELTETMPNGEYLLFVIEGEDLKRRDFSKVQVGIVFY
jgi:uncharacterized protein YwqG